MLYVWYEQQTNKQTEWMNDKALFIVIITSHHTHTQRTYIRRMEHYYVKNDKTLEQTISVIATWTERNVLKNKIKWKPKISLDGEKFGWNCARGRSLERYDSVFVLCLSIYIGKYRMSFCNDFTMSYIPIINPLHQEI